MSSSSTSFSKVRHPFRISAPTITSAPPPPILPPFLREAQERICPLPAVYHQLRKLESIVDEYVLLKHQRDRLQALSAEHPVLASIITTLNLHACSAALAATPVAAPVAPREHPADPPAMAMPPAHHAAPPPQVHAPPRPPAHPTAASMPAPPVTTSAAGDTVQEDVAAGTPQRPSRRARGQHPVDVESTGKTPLEVWLLMLIVFVCFACMMLVCVYTHMMIHRHIDAQIVT